MISVTKAWSPRNIVQNQIGYANIRGLTRAPAKTEIEVLVWEMTMAGLAVHIYSAMFATAVNVGDQNLVIPYSYLEFANSPHFPQCYFIAVTFLLKTFRSVTK
jgi:hypothetical protein